MYKRQAETILVQLLVGLAVPEPAGIRGNLIREDDLTVETPELHLKINQVNSALGKIPFHHLIDFESQLGDAVNLFLGGKAQSQMCIRDSSNPPLL